jgi:hypothetical protein
MIALSSYYELPDLISVSIRTDHLIQMYQYDSNCPSRSNWIDLARTPCPVFPPEPLNALNSIEAIIAATIGEEPLAAYFWKQSAVPSPWNTCWTNAEREGSGLDINNLVFGPHWTRYSGGHSWFPCNSEEPCNCEGPNCAAIFLTVVYRAAAATSATSLRIPLIVIVALTPTPSELDSYSWHWLMYRICCHVRIDGTPSGPCVHR